MLFILFCVFVIITAGYGWGGYSDDRKATVSSNHTYDSGIWSDNGAGARLFDGIDDRELENGTQGEDGSGAKPKALKKGVNLHNHLFRRMKIKEFNFITK